MIWDTDPFVVPVLDLTPMASSSGMRNTPEELFAPPTAQIASLISSLNSILCALKFLTIGKYTITAGSFPFLLVTKGLT